MGGTSAQATELNPMKKIFLLAMASLLAIGAQNATSAEQAQKKPAPNKAPTLYSTAPFDPTIERLNANGRFHDLLAIAKHLHPPRERGEYEKSDEYETRVANWMTTKFYGELKPTDILAFPAIPKIAPDTVNFEYDADAELLRVKVACEQDPYLAHGCWLETSYNSKNLGSRIGTTRMGVKFRVTSHVALSVGLGVKEPILNIRFSIPMDRDTAIKLKNRLGILAVGRMASPYAIEKTLSSTASLDDPKESLTYYQILHFHLQEIWLFDVQSGDVLHKQRPPF